MTISMRIQIAMRIQTTVVWLNPVLIRIGSMQIPCGRNQFELIAFNAHYFRRVDRP